MLFVVFQGSYCCSLSVSMSMTRATVTGKDMGFCRPACRRKFCNFKCKPNVRMSNTGLLKLQTTGMLKMIP